MKKAFTMIEILFVIIIIGVLAGVAVPKLFTTRTDAYVLETKEQLGYIRSNIENYHRSNIVAELYSEDIQYPNDVFFKNLIFDKMNLKNWSFVGSSKYNVNVNGIGNVVFLYIGTETIKQSNAHIPSVANANVGDFVCIDLASKCELFK